jgi:tetratricopeptide (TPR) repeat protein
MDTLQHDFVLAVAEERADATLDQWQAIVAEYGYSYNQVPPAEVLGRLMMDLLAIQDLTRRRHDSRELSELRRTAAVLAAMMAMTVANLGELRHARRWWRSARQLAEQSADRDTILWVRGREVVLAMYERRPTTEVLGLAADAEQYAPRGTPATAAAELFSGKAQALALAGRRQEAVDTLAFLRDSIFEQLPSSITSDQHSLFGWPEEKLRYTQSFVYSFLGDSGRADEAQNRAVQLYPKSHHRGRAQVELQRALCLVRDGDAEEGARHAHGTMNGLPPEHHIRLVVDLGQRVLDAVPAGDRSGAAVTEYAAYLATHGVASSYLDAS